MKSGSEFLNFLSSIGYPKVDEFQPSDFDWLFEFSDVSSFVENVCANVSHENVVTDEELNCYQELKDSDQVIFEGAILEEAVQDAKNLIPISEFSIKDEREKVEEMAEELEQLKQNCTISLSIRNRLSTYLSTLNEKESILSDEKRNAECLLMKKQDCTGLQTEMNDSLQKLLKEIRDIQLLFDPQSNEQFFMSSLNYDRLLENENMFLESIKDFLDKQFPSNELEDNNMKFDLKISTIINPALLLVQSRGEKFQGELIDEVSYILEKSSNLFEKKAICNCEIKKNEIVKKHLEDFKNSLESNSSGYLSLYQKVSCDGKLSQSEDKFHEYSKQSIPKAISNLTKQKEMLFLNCELGQEAVRLHYRILKSNEVVDALMKQKYRRIFLSSMLEIDRINHSQVNTFFKTTEEDLNLERSKFDTRMRNLSNEKEKAESEDCNIIKEKNLMALYEILNMNNGTEGGKQLVYQDLLDCKSVKRTIDEMKFLREQNFKKRWSKALTYERNFQMIETTLTKQVTDRDDNLLSILNLPDEVTKEHNSLKKNIGMLKEQLSTILKEYSDKQKELQLRLYLNETRQLFVKFCNEPENFSKLVNSKISMLKNISETKKIKSLI